MAAKTAGNLWNLRIPQDQSGSEGLNWYHVGRR